MRLEPGFTACTLTGMLRFALALLLAGPLLHAAMHAADTAAFDWPQWCGRLRQPLSDESKWKRTWPADGPRQLWRAKVGKGYAAVSVSNGRVFTAGNDGNSDTIWCLDAQSGAVVWKHSYPCQGGGGGFPGPRVAPTIDGELLYTQNVQGTLLCLESATGKPRWEQDLGKLKRTRGAKFWHGASCHPLIAGDVLIMESGGQRGNLAGFNKLTGELLWQSGDFKLGYGTPVHAVINGEPTVVAFTGSAVAGLAPQDGKVRWSYPCEVEYQCSIATPIVSADKIFVSSYYYDQGSVLLQIGGGVATPLWHSKEMLNHFNCSALWQDHLYGFHGYAQKQDKSKGATYLGCVDFKTGKLKWSHNLGGSGGLLIAGGTILALTENGELLTAEASPAGFKVISRAQVLGGTCWTMPVLCNGRIYCRDHAGTLLCLDVSE
ncbi:MAG TPA: PQQ-binding-like beta-propeller repeat protein [Planctomycetota bacterium]|nr:PQQ-binding-like beta-propeller repeat protein [Planctomycetota bacterium]